LLNKKKNGELFWESLVISPILNTQNEIGHFVAVMEDVTQKRKHHEALKQREEDLRQANITKDKFFSGEFYKLNYCHSNIYEYICQ
jgi:hypothetical protein